MNKVGYIAPAAVTWSQPVDEVLVEACNRARGWLAKPLW